MKFGIKALILSAVAGAAMSVMSTGAQAANVTLCFANAVPNVALGSSVEGVENAIVITDTNGNPLFKADNYYGNGAGGYWASTLPTTVTLPAGCSVFYFMTKSAPPNASNSWMCNNPNAALGTNVTTVTGSLAALQTGYVIIPATPNAAPTGSDAACPPGY
ncbi:hypothetical protein [Azospirillum sp. SYSU D00513]|uniref:hypothetical protein n=2 Tax=Pseudomonadati TaxID=3379134 RepID=UPI001A977948|nr:hypothetical protein [Azospirillum sp. SYSU D00513]